MRRPRRGENPVARERSPPENSGQKNSGLFPLPLPPNTRADTNGGVTYFSVLVPGHSWSSESERLSNAYFARWAFIAGRIAENGGRAQVFLNVFLTRKMSFNFFAVSRLPE